MSYQIMIIGLDQIGASIGLALANAEGDVKRLGYDADKKQMKQALEINAIDEAVTWPRRAIKNIDLLILAVPGNEVQDYLENLGPLFKEGALIIDTGGVKSLAFEWASSYLPSGRYFVAATPIVGPASLELVPFEPGEARADLFQDGLLAISTSTETPENLLAVAINLARLLDAQPFFIDQNEQDAVIAATDDLPTLLSAALMHSSAESSSWREHQRLAGQTFAFATHLVQLRPPKQVQNRFALNREKVLAKLDGIIDELVRLRLLLAGEDEDTLERYLEEANQARFSWLDLRSKADWIGQDLHPSEKIGETGLIRKFLGFRSYKNKS
jgi:prephenate dehydrogenase